MESEATGSTQNMPSVLWPSTASLQGSFRGLQSTVVLLDGNDNLQLAMVYQPNEKFILTCCYEQCLTSSQSIFWLRLLSAEKKIAPSGSG